MSQVSLIDIEGNHPQIPTEFIANIGSAIPIANQLEIFGDTVPAASTPVYTTGSGNNITTNVQISQAIAATDATKVGLAAFDSADFSVDANGFVTLSGGGSPFVGLTPDVGGQVTPIAGNINVFGVQSNSSPVMITEKIFTNLYIENRNWETAYVVDQSATVGIRGTFTTIQTAINAAVADGVAGGNDMALIYIRDGDYAENLTIPNNARIHLKGQTPVSQFGNAIYFTRINGSITLGNSSTYLVLENITQNQLVPNVVTLANSSICEATNCVINSFAGAGDLRAANCSIGGMSGLSASYLVDCEIEAALATWSLPGTHHFVNCYSRIQGGSAGAVLDINGSGIGFFKNCSGSFNISGNTNSVVAIEETTISAAVTLPNAITRISGLTVDNSVGAPPAQLITTAPTLLRGQQQGNVMIRRLMTVDGNVTNNDQYVGCNKAGALAISLVRTNFISGQVVIISDESGAAATNNITITPSAGTINGAATYVISANYGSVTLEFDGTNWFTSVISQGTSPGVFHWNDVTGVTQTIAINNGYLSDNAGTVAFTLPASAVQFSEFRIVGVQGAWTLAQNANQQIKIGNTATTVGVGGSLASTNAGDCIECIAVVGGASTIWRVMSMVGNITVV